MARAVFRRLWTALVVLFLVSVCVFFATQILPGDAAQAILGRNATPERLTALREQLRLDGNPIEQYGHWLAAVLRLDFGVSMSSGGPVSALLAVRIGNSMILMLAAALVGVPLALVIGAAAAYWRDGLFDHITAGITLVLAALPEFVIAIGLILLFSTGFWRILPATSTGTPILAHLDQLVLPALSLGLAIAPYIIRMTRAALIEVLDSDYVQHARLSGLSEGRIVFGHAIINALGAVAQVTALQLAYLAGGVVVVEYVFGFPGLGTAFVDAVSNRDLPVIQAAALFIAAFYIVVNLIADALTALANPRVRHAGK